MKNILTKQPLNDRTQGFRFNWGIYRKRVLFNRYGISKGACMTGYHFGKRSLYVQKSKPNRQLWSFGG